MLPIFLKWILRSDTSDLHTCMYISNGALNSKMLTVGSQCSKWLQIRYRVLNLQHRSFDEGLWRPQLVHYCQVLELHCAWSVSLAVPTWQIARVMEKYTCWAMHKNHSWQKCKKWQACWHFWFWQSWHARFVLLSSALNILLTMYSIWALNWSLLEIFQNGTKLTCFKKVHIALIVHSNP